MASKEPNPTLTQPKPKDGLSKQISNSDEKATKSKKTIGNKLDKKRHNKSTKRKVIQSVPLPSDDDINSSELEELILNKPKNTPPKNEEIKDQPEPSNQAETSAKKITFKELGLNQWLLDRVRNLSIRYPTEIQEKCIPAILQGRDVVGGAKTGSGKTAAFALPILHQLAIDPYGVFGLVLTPTRELAIQLADQFRMFGEGINLKLTVLVGGLSLIQQKLELTNRPHIIIATPGRLLNIIQDSPDILYLNRMKYLVLDEADMLLTDQFSETLKEIISFLPKQRQTLLFTATMTDSVTNLISKNTKEASAKPPFIHLCLSATMTVDTLMQYYVFLPSHVKEAYLVHLLSSPHNRSKSTIIFTKRCATAQLLSLMLKELEYDNVSLHSELRQEFRLQSLDRFKASQTNLLISTDVGSRGLDIPSVELVINYDVPFAPSDYVHRVGRTARAGRGGHAISLVTENDITLVHAIEEKIGKKLLDYTVNEEQILNSLNKVAKAKSLARLEMEEKGFGELRKAHKAKSARSQVAPPKKKKSKAKQASPTD